MRYLYTSSVCEYAAFEVRAHIVEWSDIDTNLYLTQYSCISPFASLLRQIILDCATAKLQQQQVTFYSFTDQSNDSNMTDQTDINHNINTDLYRVYLGNVKVFGFTFLALNLS